MRPGIFALCPDYDAAQLWALARNRPGTRTKVGVAGPGRDLRWWLPSEGGTDRRRWVADHSGLGWCGFQPLELLTARSMARLPGNPANSHSQRQALVNIVERGPMPAIHGAGAPAAEGSDPVAPAGFYILDQRDDVLLEPRIARARLSQAPGVVKSLCPGPLGVGASLKSLPATLETTPGGPPERHSSLRTVVAGRGAGGPAIRN